MMVDVSNSRVQIHQQFVAANNFVLSKYKSPRIMHQMPIRGHEFASRKGAKAQSNTRKRKTKNQTIPESRLIYPQLFFFAPLRLCVRLLPKL
jgi:hypothetical protein